MLLNICKHQLREVTPPYISQPHEIKVCYLILEAIDNFENYYILSTYT